MRRLDFRKFVLLAALALMAGACESSTEPSPDPGSGGPIEIVEPNFTGTLTVNGAAFKTFGATNAGVITVIVREIEPNPDGTARIGLALGTWNGTFCQLILTNDNAAEGGTVIGSPNTSGEFCARVYDLGTLEAPVNFTVEIKHF